MGGVRAELGLAPVVEDGGRLEPRFTERWFEGWFLAASAATAVGLWAGKRIRGAEWDEDGEGSADVELGKRC